MTFPSLFLLLLTLVFTNSFATASLSVALPLTCVS